MELKKDSQSLSLQNGSITILTNITNVKVILPHAKTLPYRAKNIEPEKDLTRLKGFEMLYESIVIFKAKSVKCNF